MSYWRFGESAGTTTTDAGSTANSGTFHGVTLGQAGAIDETYEPEWELFDLVADPLELGNVIDDPAYREVRMELEAELARLQDELGDEPYPDA